MFELIDLALFWSSFANPTALLADNDSSPIAPTHRHVT
jgi:hypothetical protein